MTHIFSDPEPTDQQAYVLALYGRLDAYRRVRGRLARGWLIWVISLFLVIFVSIPLANALLAGVAALWALQGLWALWLGWRTRLTAGEGAALLAEVEALKRQQIAAAFVDGPAGDKPKRTEDKLYAIGTDGELVEIEDPFIDDEKAAQGGRLYG